jgi:anti-sigma regulatory factor (Ser/Thr protein kinase)
MGSVVSAGHVPPLIRLAGGEIVVLGVEGDPPLGVSTVTRYHEHDFELAPGSTLLLVTDGAIEVRGEPLDRGLERLGRLLAETEGLGELCDRAVLGDVRGLPAEDDVAVLAARVQPVPERLDTTWSADANTLAGMRPLLRRWLMRHGASADEIYDITVAVQEASANAVEHAYGPGDATFDVEAEHDRGTITVTVRDRGRWRAPRGKHRGRGISMMRALMDSVDVQHREDGTTVVLRRALVRT